MNRDELLELSREPNVRAMLDAIAACEGTAGPNGYKTMFGGGLFPSFDRHPGKVVTATMKGKPIASSAAGRYQFLSKTWSTLAERYGFPSFEPQWQDAGAVALIEGRGALDEVRAGRIVRAVALLNREWASLPGSPYGQPIKTMTFVIDTYLRAGGRLDGGAPIENRTAPPTASPQPAQEPAGRPDAPILIETIADAPAARQEPRMLPAVVAALIPSLIELIPEIGKLFGDGPKTTKNAQVIQDVAKVVVAATGAPNLQGAVEAMQSDPDALEAARDAVRREWFDLQEKATAAAHDRMNRYNAQTEIRTIWLGLTFIEWLSAWLVVTGTMAGAYVLVKGEAQFGNQIIGMVVTLLVIGGVVGVREFWLGTSSESRRKTDMLLERDRQP
jgi:muramidase (phage lysozyme)